MKQLDLFDTTMQPEPLPTGEELNQRIQFIDNRKWYRSIQQRWHHFGQIGDHETRHHLAAEFSVKEYVNDNRD